MEEWGIINPEVRGGRKVYSQDDITLGKLIVEMDEVGLGVRDGFDAEALRYYRDMFREIVVMSHKYYFEATLGKLSPAEFSKRIVQGREIMSAFFYHLYRKLSREEYRRILNLMEGAKKNEAREHLNLPWRRPPEEPSLGRRGRTSDRTADLRLNCQNGLIPEKEAALRTGSRVLAEKRILTIFLFQGHVIGTKSPIREILGNMSALISIQPLPV